MIGRRVAATCGLVIWAGLMLSGQGGDDLRARSKAALSQTSGEIAIAGLEQPVEVVRDRFGIPHIYAKSVHDLFFAQGFVAAQDRLWQLDLWRRIAEGKLSELLGPAGLTRDTFARLLRYRGDMDVEWRSYRPDARAIVEAFVAGINAQIAVATNTPGKLPIEFQLTGIRPEPWTPEVVISRMAGYIMTRNARSEVQRARTALSSGLERLRQTAALDPPATIGVPEGLDLADITEEVLSLAAGSGESVDFSPLLQSVPAGVARHQASRGGPLLLGPRAIGWRPWGLESVDVTALQALAGEDPFWNNGSNNWVVSGRLSATGKPLLANDPHRTILLPSLRYTVHLNGPGWNVIGAGEPALPGIAAGHNDRVAFGFTIVGIDQQDLYVERLDPADSDRYFYQGRSEPMRVERERVQVRGEAPREIELRFTRHGPVLHRDIARGRAYALRWVGAEPGSAGYLRSLALDTARNWDEFLRAVDGWKVPSENIVYADVDGNIGWVAAGAAPIRPNWNGLMPVPGHEGAYEWQGFLPRAELPQLFNPASGFIATANHNILPPDYDKVLGYEFSNAYRFTRILEVISGAKAQGRRLTAGDFERLQHDELSVTARAVCGALRAALPGRPMPEGEAGRAATMLAEWDGVLAKDSAPAALYQTWLPLLTRAAGDALAKAHVAAADAGAARLNLDRLLGLFEATRLIEGPAVVSNWVDGSPRPRSRPVSLEPARVDPTRSLLVSALTGQALAEAWREAAKQMGPDPSKWAWGRMHRARFEHALAFTPERREVMNLGEVPRGGDGTTPNATGSGARQTAGASFREVIDVGDWDRSTTINVPGASGQPGSPYYGDLLPLWAEGKYHPMAFSRAALEKVAAVRLRLVPDR